MFNDTNISYPTEMPLAVLAPPKKERLYTLAEYLEREENSRELHEYYNGKIIKLPMARGPHNIITGNMTIQLGIASKSMGNKFILMVGQQLVYLPKLNFSLYPDALVVSDTPQYFDQNEVLLINPTLIVEVLSKSTKKYDRNDKFDEYRTLDSFQEYVLIDQKNCYIEIRHREQKDFWRYSEITNINDSIFLKSIGVSIAVADIYANIKL
jgi:Uma2 family endonuclease